MTVRTAELVLSIPHAHSLKDKRQVVRSLIDAIRHRFNVSIAEVATQDQHQLLTIGLALVSGDASHAQQMLGTVLDYIEENADATVISVDMD